MALEKVSGALVEARAKLQDVELKLKTSQDALVEKEAMINYVQEEVDRVKGVRKEEAPLLEIFSNIVSATGLFEKREGRLREERDLARIQAEAARAERDAAMAQVQELIGKLEALAKDLEVSYIFSQCARLEWLDAPSSLGLPIPWTDHGRCQNPKLGHLNYMQAAHKLRQLHWPLSCLRPRMR